MTSDEKIFKNLNEAKASRIYHISTTCLQDSYPVIVIHLANIINLSIKLDHFSLNRKIAKTKPSLKKN